MDALAQEYAERKVQVLNTIYSVNTEKLRAFSNGAGSVSPAWR